jgi:hypothetical protein
VTVTRGTVAGRAYLEGELGRIGDPQSRLTADNLPYRGRVPGRSACCCAGSRQDQSFGEAVSVGFGLCVDNCLAGDARSRQARGFDRLMGMVAVHSGSSTYVNVRTPVKQRLRTRANVPGPRLDAFVMRRSGVRFPKAAPFVCGYTRGVHQNGWTPWFVSDAPHRAQPICLAASLAIGDATEV